MNKYRIISIYIQLGIIILALLTAFYWLFWPNRVIIYDNPDQIQVDKKVYNPGDRIVYTIKYCKKKNIQGVVSRALVNGTRLNFTEYTTNVAPGCNTVKINDMVIPDYADEGIYHIETTATYQTNPLRTFVGTWRSVDFEIVKGKIE